ncbi:MAG: LPS export ABC transporter periplasmic protein LptC [Candidatus Zixiibacteriota bacterium]|nr:MAG: LPS export ABC transporter periplasmic protein LptC [candidate division Zixibacteria bacterium]
MIRHYFIPLFCSALMLLGGCGSGDRSKNTDPGPVDSAARPDTETRGAKIVLLNEDQVTGEILADEIHKFEAIDSAMGYGLDIVLYDSAGRPSSWIVGDSGVIHDKRGDFKIYGNVVVISEDSTRLETDFLTWNRETDRLRTDAFVRITDKDSNVVTGWGMEAERNPTRYRILQQVSGNIRDTRDLDK